MEGPGFASVTYADPYGHFTIDKSCSLSIGLAFCGTSTGSESAIAVETPIYLAVQAGATIAALITAPPTPQPTEPTAAPAKTSSCQKQIPLSYFGLLFTVWLVPILL